MKEVQLFKYSPSGITQVGMVDDFTSLSFQRSFSQVGNWQMVLPANSLSALQMQDADIIRLAPGVAGWVTNREQRNDNTQSILTVSGVELKGITASRVIIPPDGSAYFNVNNTPEYVIAQFLDSQLVNPADTKRAVLCSVTSYEDSGNLYKESFRYSNLKDAITAIAVPYGVGWYADIEAGEIVFHIIHCTDRSASQTTNSRIVLSYANDNILQSSITAVGNLPETALVAGQGEGDSREIYVVGDEKEGLQRKELFIDARDISDSTQLEGRGLEKLAAYGSGVAYECTLSTSFTSLYRQAYDVGDMLTIQDETLAGGSLDATLTAVTEVYEAGGLRLDVVQGYDTGTLTGVLSRISSSTESLIATDTISYDTIVTLETQITQMNGYIQTKADKTTTDSQGNAISNNYTELTQDAEGLSLRIGTAEGTLTNVNNNLTTLNGFKTTQETLIHADSVGVHVGNAGFKAETLVASDGLHIKDNTGFECANFTDNKSYIRNANITDTMQIGGVQFVKYSTGRIAVKWVG